MALQRNAAWIVAALLFVALAFMHQRRFDSATPASRLDLLHALIVDRTIAIDTYHLNTPDKAANGGHYYSDKAPGTAVFSFPSFALAAIVLQARQVSLDSEPGWLASSWAASAGSNALLAALGGAALFSWLRRWVTQRCALLTVVALFLGGAPLPYSTMLFSHAMVVGLLSTGVWAIAHRSDQERASSQNPQALRGWLSKRRFDLLSGTACGWALASEYTAGTIVVGLFIWLVLLEWRRAAPFALGAIPPLLLIPAYSWACLGTPFALPYSYQASFPQMQEGLYAIRWPDAVTAFRLLFGPTRGLFFWTPFLAIAWLGYSRLQAKSPRWFWLTYAVPMVQVIVISGRTWDWQAGPSLGPRYLAPIIPLLALPCALGMQRFPKLGIALAACSILTTTLATLTDACPAGLIYNPLIELHIPLFLKGEFSPNLGMVLGLPPYASIVLFYAILIGGIWWLWKRLAAEEGKTRCLQDGTACD